jgi:choline dehydrogenase
LNLEMRFDVVVAGGGTAGCVVAARLSEEPSRSVCLVEAGPDYGRYERGLWPADLLDGFRLAFSHSWETEREDRSQLRARVLGGCSAHNACVVLRGVSSDYDWGDGWSYAALEPYFDRAEEMLRARKLTQADLTPWHAAWAEGAGSDVILHPVNMVGSVRWNVAFAYLDPARNRPNLTIRPDTLVDRIEGDTLVTDHGDIQARAIVLAAGAYGSPATLLRSGLGPPVGENLGLGARPCARRLSRLLPPGGHVRARHGRRARRPRRRPRPRLRGRRLLCVRAPAGEHQPHRRRRRRATCRTTRKRVVVTGGSVDRH